MDVLNTLENLVGRSAEDMHDTDILWYTKTVTLHEAIAGEVVEPLQARIADLEAEVARLTERNRELSAAIDGCAGQWTPMPEGAHYCGCSEEDCTGEWRIENNGSRLVIGDGESELSIEFYEAIRVCWRVQPSINA